MFLGRYQVGDWVPLDLQSETTAWAPSLPTAAAVTAKIYNSSNTLVATVELTILNNDRHVGYMTGRWLATAQGRFTVVWEWTVTTAQKKVAVFDVAPGGSSTGAAVAMHVTRQPEADYVLIQGANGTVYYGRNPY